MARKRTSCKLGRTKKGTCRKVRRPRHKNLYPDVQKTVTSAKRLRCGTPKRIAKTRAVLAYLGQASAFEAAVPTGVRSKAATKTRLASLRRIAKSIRTGVRTCNRKALKVLKARRAAAQHKTRYGVLPP